MPVMREIGFTALSAAGSIVVLFLLAKLIGARQVSQMTLFDYVVGITIGSVAAELAVEIQHPVGPLTALVVYGVAAVGIAVLTNKSLKARTAVTGKPLILLENGVIYRENLRKAHLDLDEFLTYCRIGGWFDLNELETAVLEHNGAVSFLPRETARPATPMDLDLSPQQTRMQVPFIMDGPPDGGEYRTGRKGAVLGAQLSAAPGLSGGAGSFAGGMGWRSGSYGVPHGPKPEVH